MFEILDGRKSFFQWDLNQKLIIFDDSITEVHFCNKTDECALVCEVYKEGSLSLVNVPNILLQQDWSIRVYGVAADHTEHYAVFKVFSRSKPADYVYTETEVKTFSLLEKRIEELEATVSVEGIAQAVEDYLEANPVEAGATAEEARQIAQNTEDISILQEQTADFALKIEIPSIEGLATEEFVNDAVEAIDIPEVDLTPYALKTEIPSVEGLASEEYVDNAIDNINLPTGGGNKEWQLIKHLEIEDAALDYTIPLQDGAEEYGIYWSYTGETAPQRSILCDYDKADFGVMYRTMQNNPFFIRVYKGPNSILVLSHNVKYSADRVGNGGTHINTGTEFPAMRLTTNIVCNTQDIWIYWR